MLAPRKWVCSSAWLERTPDKGEVGSSSLPRPTIHFNTNSLYKRALARFSKEYINSIAQNISHKRRELGGNYRKALVF